MAVERITEGKNHIKVKFLGYSPATARLISSDSTFLISQWIGAGRRARVFKTGRGSGLWVQVDGRRVTCEACHTLNGSWGCDRDNLDWKSPELLVRMLIDTVSKGGNLLLLVGKSGRKGKRIHPRMNGKFPFVYLFIRMAPRHHAQLGGCIQQPGNSPLHEVNVPA